LPIQSVAGAMARIGVGPAVSAAALASVAALVKMKGGGGSS